MARRRKRDQAQSEMPLEPDYAALAKLSDAELIDVSYRLGELLTEHRGYKEALKTETRRLRAEMERTALEINQAVRKLLDARHARQQKGLDFEAAVPTHTAASALAEVAKIAGEGEATVESEPAAEVATDAAPPVDSDLPSLDGPEPEVSPDPFTACTKCGATEIATADGISYSCMVAGCDWIGIVRTEATVPVEEIARPDAKRHAVTVHGVTVKPIIVLGDDDSERPMWLAIHPRMADITARGETPDAAFAALGIPASDEDEAAGITGERVSKFSNRRGRARTRAEVAEASATA